MEDEATWLCRRIDTYRQIARAVADERAIKAIRQLIAEMEERLKQIKEG